jgi:hypothetical protein
MNRLAAIALLVATASAASATAAHAQSFASPAAAPVAPVASVVPAASSATAPVSVSRGAALADYRTATIIAAETTRCGSKLCDDYILTSADTQYYVRAAHRAAASLAAGATELFHVDGTAFRIAADGTHKSRTLTVVSVEPLHPVRPYLHGIG